jgi:hypothetical protein
MDLEEQGCFMWVVEWVVVIKAILEGSVVGFTLVKVFF